MYAIIGYAVLLIISIVCVITPMLAIMCDLDAINTRDGEDERVVERARGGLGRIEGPVSQITM